ncbi:MAG: methyltransferase domain-containing protein [Candidatus Bathyarchaeia archaeon]
MTLGTLRKIRNSFLFISAAILGAIITLVAVIAIHFEEKPAPEKKTEKEPIAFFASKKRAMVFYRFLSKVYDIVNPFFYDETMRETIVNWAGVREGSLVLDVGCGTGYTTEGILKKLSDGEVVCLDFTRQQLEKAVIKLRERGNTMFLMGDAENLPFKEDVFDTVLSTGAIEYFPNPKRDIQEMSRVAKPGGKVAIVGPEFRWFKKLLLNRVLYTPSMEELQKIYSEVKLKNIKTFLSGVNTFFGTDKYAVIIVGVKAS